jgi:hypothetical protein
LPRPSSLSRIFLLIWGRNLLLHGERAKSRE